MLEYQVKNGRTIPLLEIPEETNGQPFQKYGTLILKYLEEFQPERYQQLLVNGTLMEKIREREAEIIDMEMTVLERLENTRPRPKTEDLLAVTRYYNQLKMEAEEIAVQGIYQPL